MTFSANFGSRLSLKVLSRWGLTSVACQTFRTCHWRDPRVARHQPGAPMRCLDGHPLGGQKQNALDTSPVSATATRIMGTARNRIERREPVSTDTANFYRLF